MGPATIIALVGVFCALGALLLAIGIHRAITGLRTRPRPGMELPVSSRALSHGWRWYDLRPIGVHLACTVAPKPLEFDKRHLASRMDISEYGGYAFAGRHLHTRVYAYWMRRRPSSPNAIADYVQRRQKDQIPGIKRSWQATTVIAGEPGRLVACEYSSRGYTSVSKVALLLRGNVCYFIEGTYFKDGGPWAPKAYEYELRTARIAP